MQFLTNEFTSQHFDQSEIYWPSQFLKVSVVGQTQAQPRYLPGQLHWLSLKWLPPFPFLAVSPAPSTPFVQPHRQIH